MFSINIPYSSKVTQLSTPLSLDAAHPDLLVELCQLGLLCGVVGALTELPLLDQTLLASRQTNGPVQCLVNVVGP